MGVDVDWQDPVRNTAGEGRHHAVVDLIESEQNVRALSFWTGASKEMFKFSSQPNNVTQLQRISFSYEFADYDYIESDCYADYSVSV